MALGLGEREREKRGLEHLIQGCMGKGNTKPTVWTIKTDEIERETPPHNLAKQQERVMIGGLSI